MDWKNIRTNKELADLSGVRGNYISRWLKGGGGPNADNLKKIADALGVSMDYLWTGEHQENQTIKEKLEVFSLVFDKLSSENDCKYVTGLIAEIDNFKDPTKVEATIQIIKLLGDLPGEKVVTLLKVVEAFIEEKRGGE